MTKLASALGRRHTRLAKYSEGDQSTLLTNKERTENPFLHTATHDHSRRTRPS